MITIRAFKSKRDNEFKNEREKNHLTFVCMHWTEPYLLLLRFESNLKFHSKKFKSMGAKRRKQLYSMPWLIWPMIVMYAFSVHTLCKCAQRWLHLILKLIHSVRCAVIFLFFLRSFSVCLLISLRIKHGNKLTNIQKIVVLKMNTILNSYYYCWNAMNEWIPLISSYRNYEKKRWKAHKYSSKNTKFKFQWIA